MTTEKLSMSKNLSANRVIMENLRAGKTGEEEEKFCI
jgi:hypothetical protein